MLCLAVPVFILSAVKGIIISEYENPGWSLLGMMQRMVLALLIDKRVGDVETINIVEWSVLLLLLWTIDDCICVGSLISDLRTDKNAGIVAAYAIFPLYLIVETCLAWFIFPSTFGVICFMQLVAAASWFDVTRRVVWMSGNKAETCNYKLH